MQPDTDNSTKPGLGGWMKSSGSRLNVMGIGLIALYLIILPVSLWLVYSTQNARLENSETQRIAAVDQAARANLIPDEAADIDKDKYQAVFLDNGQVYFGKITELNPQYVTITKIYYLNTDGDLNQLKDDGNVSLVRLGCELHGPADKMVINRSSVTFWENMRADGQVVKAINAHIKTTNDSQNCD